MKHEKSCGAVIIKKSDDEYLFLIVSHKCDGYWGLPKGHMEVGEREEETVVREAFEETGLNIELVNGFRAKIEYLINEDTNKEVVFFIGKPKDDKAVNIQETEIEDYKWVNLNKAMELLTHIESKNVLNEVNKFLTDRSL